MSYRKDENQMKTQEKMTTPKAAQQDMSTSQGTKEMSEPVCVAYQGQGVKQNTISAMLQNNDPVSGLRHMY